MKNSPGITGGGDSEGGNLLSASCAARSVLSEKEGSKASEALKLLKYVSFFFKRSANPYPGHFLLQVIAFPLYFHIILHFLFKTLLLL